MTRPAVKVRRSPSARHSEDRSTGRTRTRAGPCRREQRRPGRRSPAPVSRSGPGGRGARDFGLLPRANAGCSCRKTAPGAVAGRSESVSNNPP
jgi:hypothetical protein